MSHEAPLVLVDALHALLSANGTTPALVEEALLRIQAMKQHPNDALVLGVPTLLEALAHWYRVTGGDEVTEALAQWLDTMDPKTAVGLDRRLLAEVQLLCPRLIPMAATPKAPVDPRFASFVELLSPALAEASGFANVDAWKSAVASCLDEVFAKSGNFGVTALPHALFSVAEKVTAFGEDNPVHVVMKRLSEAYFTPEKCAELGIPSSFFEGFDVYQERTVVSEVRDASTEVAASDFRLEGHDVEVGDVLALRDDELTQAFRVTLLVALGR